MAYIVFIVLMALAHAKLYPTPHVQCVGWLNRISFYAGQVIYDGAWVNKWKERFVSRDGITCILSSKSVDILFSYSSFTY